jgi:beta-glucosidase-like glycosyl hydrolase
MKILSLFLISLSLFAACSPARILNNGQDSSKDNILDKQVEPFQGEVDWVDDTMAKLSVEERIAQLFMVAGYSNRGPAHADSLEKLVKNYGIGGVAWFQGGPVRQTIIANRLQQASKIPLLYAMDAEWGIGMRLDSTMNFPHQMALGAIYNDSLITAMGRQIAQDFRRLGMHINFAPVADVNNNPANPVISYRSFGEDRSRVSQKAIAYAKGLQEYRILTSGKHFPGHGDTDVDSHYALPVIKHNRSRLDSLELYPFRKMIEEGITGLMVAHLNIPSLDSTSNLPSSLSAPIITELLRNELGFKGLIFSDAMNMKGVTDFFPTGEAEVRALIAGNDILVMPPDVPKAMDAIKKALQEGRISQEDIDTKVRRVLHAKQWAGLMERQTVSLDNLHKDLNSSDSFALNQTLAEEFVTLIRKDENSYPVAADKKTAVLSIGPESMSRFQQTLGDGYSTFWLSWQTSEAMANAIRKELTSFDRVIIAVHDMRRRPFNRLNIPKWIENLLDEESRLPGRSLVLFSNPYTWLQIPGADAYKTLIMAYENTDYAQKAAADIITGRKPSKGSIPVRLGETIRVGEGIQSK